MAVVEIECENEECGYNDYGECALSTIVVSSDGSCSCYEPENT